jgi:hypothetical protein
LKGNTIWIASICLVLGAFMGYPLGAQITLVHLMNADLGNHSIVNLEAILNPPSVQAPQSASNPRQRIF